jgi:hypothetical protein
MEIALADYAGRKNITLKNKRGNELIISVFDVHIAHTYVETESTPVHATISNAFVCATTTCGASSGITPASIYQYTLYWVFAQRT